MVRIFITLLTLFIISIQGKNISIILDWFPNADHAPIYVAKQQGYFKDAGLNLKIITPSDPSDAPKLVADEKADIGIDYETHYVTQNKLPIKYVGNLIDAPLDVLVTLKSSGIDKLHLLNNKMLAASTKNLFLKKWLKINGAKNVKLVSVHYDLIQALLSNQVDGVNGLDRNLELIKLKNMNIPINVFYPEKSGIPHYNELIYIVNSKNQNKLWLKHFFTALTKGTRYLKKHPKQTWLVFAKNHPALNNRLNQESWMATLQYFPDDPSKVDKNTTKALQRFMTH